MNTAARQHVKRVAFALLLPACLLGACRRERPADPFVRGNARVQGHYSANDGRLELITLDRNANGTVDTWSYMDLARVVRIELDEDEDGRIDRWEHYGADQELEKVGYSRAGDGREDAWAYPGPDGTAARIEIAGARDGRITRTEYYERGQLARAEEDSNADGRPDKWETYEDGRLAVVAFDTAGRGAPDRRLVYGADGSVRAEIDPDGTGTFRPAGGR